MEVITIEKIIHLRKLFACGEAKRKDSIVIISRLYKSTARSLNNSVCTTSSSLSKSSLKIDLMWLLTLPENTPNKEAISQADIQTGVVGICTFPFSPMVMIYGTFLILKEEVISFWLTYIDVEMYLTFLS